MSEEVTLPVHEFGEAISVSSRDIDGLNDTAREMLESKIANFKKVISYISDAHFVKEPEIVVGPVVDVLQRFRAFGYHAYVASEGYNVLKGYFRNELYAGIQDEVLKMYPPIPTKITFKFVVKMFKQWILNINLRPDKELED